MILLENRDLLKALAKECDEIIGDKEGQTRLRIIALDFSIVCYKLLLLLGEEND